MMNQDGSNKSRIVACVVLILFCTILAAVHIGSINTFSAEKSKEAVVLYLEPAEQTDGYETFENVESMKSTTAPIGTVVSTLGYYSANDGGGINYQVDAKKEFGGIELTSGLYANPIFSGGVLNVKAVGAVGDGVHDDATIINNALNSGYTKVSFPKAEYACNSHIAMKTPGVTVEGNESTLVTNDNFSAAYYEFFYLINTKNIVVNNLKLECRETNRHRFKTQMGIVKSRGVTISKCTFYIPNEVMAANPYKETEYSNLDVYTGNYNINIDGCTMIDEADAYAGLCCQIRDLYGNGSSDIRFTNNICVHKGRDEIIGAYSNVLKGSSSNSISNIVIDGNKFYQSNGNYTRNVGMSLGGDNNQGCDYLTFTNNYVEVHAVCMTFKFGSSRNVDFSNNTLNCYLDNSNIATNVFFGSDQASDINIKDNNITINMEKKNHYKLGNAYVTIGNNEIFK